MAELGLITYQTEYDPQIGCNIPTDITFTPALFSALDVSDVAVVAARRSRVEWENQQRKKQNLKPLEMDELIAKSWRFVRERFRSYQSERKQHGLKRACSTPTRSNPQVHCDPGETTADTGIRLRTLYRWS